MHRRFQNEIVHRDFCGIGAFPGGLQFPARGHQRPGVDFNGEIKMRDGTQTLHEPFGNSFAHAGKLNARTFAGFDGRCGRFCRRCRLLRRGRFRFRRCSDICFGHAAVGAGSFDTRKIDTELGSDTTRDGRGFYSCLVTLVDFCGGRGFFLFGLGAFLTFLLFLRWRGFLFFFLSFGRLFRFGLRFLFFFCFRLLLFFLFRFVFLFRCFFTFFANERDLVADIYLSAFLDVDFGERAVLGRFPFHCRLVGLDLGQDLTGRNFVALLFLPRNERSLRHRVAELGHLDLRHMKK